MSDQQIEAEIQAKGLTAPRVTPADIEASIASEHYFTARDGTRQSTKNQIIATGVDLQTVIKSLELLTFCVLTLRNGFTVTGESACASPENFDAEVSQKIARANAVNKIWPLEGYLLKERLYQKSACFISLFDSPPPPAGVITIHTGAMPSSP